MRGKEKLKNNTMNNVFLPEVKMLMYTIIFQLMS